MFNDIRSASIQFKGKSINHSVVGALHSPNKRSLCTVKKDPDRKKNRITFFLTLNISDFGNQFHWITILGTVLFI